MGGGQRIVRSIKDRSGNAYTKTSAGGKARASSAAKYMDQQEEKDLYRYEPRAGLSETNRHEVAELIEQTETKYQQHMAFTTQLRGDTPMLPHHEQQTVQDLAQAIQARRPDAEIYALAVHQQGAEGNIHVHVVFGTETTLRHDDLRHFREVSYQMERQLQQRLEMLQIDWKVNLREEVNKEGSRVQQVQKDDPAPAKHSGKAPNLDLNDLKGGAPEPERAAAETQKRQKDRGYEWGR